MADLIRPATTTPARLLRQEGELGVAVPGALADLLVIGGNPLDDIGVLATPEQTLKLIIKQGKGLQKRALKAAEHPRQARASTGLRAWRVRVESPGTEAHRDS
jgi:hypothetical protein